MTSANKVGDLFSAAGEAFSKLAELTHIIQTSLKNNEDNAESVWSAKDTELLQTAVKRFGDELNVISEHIKDKTMHQIKTTFRKIQPSLSSAINDKTNATANSVTYSSHDSAAFKSLSGSASIDTSSSAALSNSSNIVTSASFPQTSTAGGSNVINAASNCSSPSPFLHYPLLRKSADITLNMLNARDDSDDDERMALSVFNSI